MSAVHTERFPFNFFDWCGEAAVVVMAFLSSMALSFANFIVAFIELIVYYITHPKVILDSIVYVFTHPQVIWEFIIHLPQTIHTLFYAAADAIAASPIPVTIALVVLYSFCCEVIPRGVTRLNSNAYTSQTVWNVTLKGLRFQLVNYYLYHTLPFAIITHGITILADALLWTMYFHYLLLQNPVWAFCFIFFMCLLQALTFDSVSLKIYLITIEGLLIGTAGVVYHFYLSEKYPSDGVFGHVSLWLLVNAFARVISHMPEPLPIDYLGLHNTTPIAEWYKNPKTCCYMMRPIHLFIGLAMGEVSELQAGLPVRLLTSAIIMILTRMGVINEQEFKLNMPSLKHRADEIDRIGWKADPVGSKLFSWEEDSDVQQMFVFAAQRRRLRRQREGQVMGDTWLSKEQQEDAGIVVPDDKKKK